MLQLPGVQSNAMYKMLCYSKRSVPVGYHTRRELSLVIIILEFILAARAWITPSVEDESLLWS